jgi:energy-coupling factor transport system permease protein
LLLSVAVGGFAVVLDRPASLAILAGACVGALAVAPIPRGRKAAVLATAALVMVSTAWTQGLFYAGVPRTALVSAGPVTLWREGVAHGAVQALRLVATAVAGLTVALSTPPDRLFAGLVALRVPHGAAFLAVAALRFVPAVADEWVVVRFARSRRGRPLLPRWPGSAFREELGMLAPIAARTIRRARVLAESLELRGFDPQLPRRLRVPLRAGRAEVALLGAVYAVLLAAAVAKGLYLAYVLDVGWSSALRPLYGAVRAWL